MNTRQRAGWRDPPKEAPKEPAWEPSGEPIPIMRPHFGREEAEAAAAAVHSGWVAQGPRVAGFEQAFRERVGAKHAVALSSCTAGLHLALVITGVGRGDEVIVPSLSFIATANAPRYVGATPVFADVDPATQNVTPATVEAVLTPATRAVIVVHQAGVPADLDAIRALCDPLGIAVIEDAACAIGSIYRGRSIGSGRSLAAFSFHPRKIITTGEGGMVTTPGAEAAARMRRLREHGMSLSAAERHRLGAAVMEQYLETGFNYRMTDVQAAIGLVQLSRLEAIVLRRRTLAARYHERLSEIAALQMVHDPPYGTTNYQSFWVVLPDDAPVSRNGLLQRLTDTGVACRRGIMAAHLEPAFRHHRSAALPVTERLTSRSLLLPLFHDMTETQQDRVIESFRREVAG